MTTSELDVRARQQSLITFEQLDQSVSVIQGIDVAEKEALVGVPFIVTNVNLNKGEFGEFVSLTIVTKDNYVSILNDGSTGIMAQVEAFLEAKKLYQEGVNTYDLVALKSPLKASRGLSRSDYQAEVNGKKVAASTYYMR